MLNRLLCLSYLEETIGNTIYSMQYMLNIIHITRMFSKDYILSGTVDWFQKI